MSKYYDKKGSPISLVTWQQLFENKSYQIIKQTHIESGPLEGGMISTVWLGLDHRYGHTNGLPLIFETMVLNKKYEDLECSRASTEEEALMDHEDYSRRYILSNTNKPTSRWKNLEIE